jgi:hypothetical protein
MTNKTLVISAATGYTPKQIRPFLESLYQYCPETLVVLIVMPELEEYQEEFLKFNKNTSLYMIRNILSTNDLVQKVLNTIYRSLRKIGFSDVIFNKLLNYIPVENHLKREFIKASFYIPLSRYFFAQELILEKYKDAEKILLSDSRDVFFQADPFVGLDQKLFTGLENIKVKDCNINKVWLERLYSYHELENIFDEPVLCSGVTLGQRDAILDYLETMCLSLSQRLISAACRHGLDQGIHNWILRTTNHVEVELIPNGHPLIATLHHFTNDMFIFDENQGLLTKDLELVKIVHQYDRHKFLQSWIKEKYST